MDKVPLSGKEDWMARLNFQRLKDTLIEGGAQNWKSDIHGHPIPGLAHGAAFGLQAPKTAAISSPFPKPPKPVKLPAPVPAAPQGIFGSFFGAKS